MTTHTIPHTATSVLFGCIDDRLTAADSEFINQHGGAFHPALAGGGAAFLDPEARSVALSQIVAAYRIAGATTIYLESHTDCGAYRLAGVRFDSLAAEIDRLTADLKQAAKYVKAALIQADAPTDAIEIFIRIINPAGHELDLQRQP
ncbi:MAG TPA: hypothetical protein VMT30_07825 [Candidatus Saccharimonadia bacterium]|nr:hypothetical protein [Candidatus Saccharimonadia bacterium]